MIPAKLVNQTKLLQLKTSNAAVVTARRALPDLSKLPQQTAGAVFRTVAASSITQFGNVATQAARISYDQMRSGVSGNYQAIPVAIEPAKAIDSVVGRAMSVFTQDRFIDSENAYLDALGRVVGDIFRETIANNSFYDEQAVSYQRVASATACAFCMTVALNEYTSYADSGGYHDNCNCTTVPVFRNIGAYRPAYYDTFESDYTAATLEAGGSTKNVLATIRANTSRR